MKTADVYMDNMGGYVKWNFRIRMANPKKGELKLGKKDFTFKTFLTCIILV